MLRMGFEHGDRFGAVTAEQLLGNHEILGRGFGAANLDGLARRFRIDRPARPRGAQHRGQRRALASTRVLTPLLEREVHDLLGHLAMGGVFASGDDHRPARPHADVVLAAHFLERFARLAFCPSLPAIGTVAPISGRTPT